MDFSLYFQLFLFLISLFVYAFYSFLETVITALRLFKLKEISESSDRYKKLFSILEQKPHQVIVTILLANNIANVTAAALITRIMGRIFIGRPGLSLSLGIGIATFAILIFGEILPKNFAKSSGEKLFKSTLWVTNFTYFLLYPLVKILDKISNFIISIITKKTFHIGENTVSEREIQFLINYISKKGTMETEKTEMLKSIFKLSSTVVKDIMVSATDIVSLDINSSMQDVLDLFTKYQYTRFPLYQDKPDNIIGMLYLKDLLVILSKGEKSPLRKIMRPILFVPESMKLNQLLKEFRNQRMHIAIVIDEYGLTSGLITLEDILEEIVGEIVDEHELVEEKIVGLSKGGWMADASIDLNKLSKVLGVEFEVEDANSLGGFLAERLQRLPKKGEFLIYKDYKFIVQKTTPKKILQVLILNNKKHT